MKVMAQYILLDWENILDGKDNKEITYSADNVFKMFQKHPRFFDMVFDYASDVTMFKDDAEEEDLGN